MTKRTLVEIVASARRNAPGWQSDDLERLLAVAEAAEAFVAARDAETIREAMAVLYLAVRGGAK